MATQNIILVARNETRIMAYGEVLAKLGYNCHPLLDIREVPPVAASSAFSGILLDMPVMAKASLYEKSMIDNVIQTLPSAYINIAPATDIIKLLIATGNHGTATSLEDFLNICNSFTPRMVRPNDRIPLNLNALLLNHDLPDLPEKTVTLNVSRQGCFLFSASQESKPGQTITAEFIGLEDTSEITATIKWVRHWGEVHQLPGIGVNFDRISDSQIQQLSVLMAPLKVQK